jgi:hypothetical protein
MEGAQPLANGGKLDELEKLVDRALEMLGETEMVPDVYRREYDKEGILSACAARMSSDSAEWRIVTPS